MTLRDLLDTPDTQLLAELATLGEPAYRLKQVRRWIFKESVVDFAAMTDLPRRVREAFAERYRVLPLEMIRAVESADGWTRKFLFAVSSSAARLPRSEATSSVETVLMRYDPTDSARGRLTACVSSQVGCAVGCPFCATGQAGFVRNLTAGEIVAQVLALNALLRPAGERVTNIVLMGQGEPLLNLEAVWRAIEWFHDPDGLGIGARHITLSTVGIIPGIEAIAERTPPVRLAVSLHAPNDALRNQLVPLNRRYPLADLLAACRRFVEKSGRRITFEYALLAETNDHPALARELARRLAGLPCHVNLIPVNPTPAGPYARPSAERIAEFQRILRAARIPTTVRVERGIDIFAGCGQLRADEARQRGPAPALAGKPAAPLAARR
ncbi:MAG: 23S rRNA (adenine(2503)-C(2))-methyltransferase RlmN [Chloroflexota bacterium]|nr:23S rRNA (adenine(2503)-C(2))-methyltransferase RlmN [Dehalococcoidia bacterium]MDW8255075.1 23S rRNA (adenine(2503)-C(2))-methyltransferase RlmN [Chloroflexota bacterium]